jgi:hypothetical protein
MYNIAKLEQKRYHLYDIRKGEYDGYFYDYQHVLWYFKNADLTDLAHNVNDKKQGVTYLYNSYIRELTTKPYMLLDSLLRVVSAEQIAKDVLVYQRTYPNPYRAIKRGTNKKRADSGMRGYRSYKNVLATLLGDKDIIPLNKRDVAMRQRVFDWDAGQMSNSGSSWKLQKKKYQWEEKC